MSNIPITPGTGVSSVATETIGGFDYQKIKLFDGTAVSTNALKVNADGSLTASVYGNLGITGTPSISGAITIVGTPSVTVGGNPSISGTVAATQQGAWTASVVGGPISLYAPSASLVSMAASVITGTASVLALPTAPGGQRNYITQLLVTNAAPVGTTVSITDGGNIIYSGFAAASGGGFSASFPAPLRQASLAGSLGAISSVQASVIVAVSGFTAP